MITRKAYLEYADKVVYQRCVETLEQMVQDGEIDATDLDRFKRKFDYLLPPVVDNTYYIDLVAQLQQKEGDEREKKKA